MSSASVTAPGAAAFVGSLEQAAAALGELAEVNTNAGELVLGAARIPRRTGRLDRSARVLGSVDGFTLTAGGPSAPHAPIVHAYNPFLTDALTTSETDVVDLYLGHAERALDTIQGD